MVLAQGRCSPPRFLGCRGCGGRGGLSSAGGRCFCARSGILSTVTDWLVVYGIHVVSGVLTPVYAGGVYVPLTLPCVHGYSRESVRLPMIGYCLGPRFRGPLCARGGSFFDPHQLARRSRTFPPVAILSFLFWFIPHRLDDPALLLGPAECPRAVRDAPSDHADARNFAGTGRRSPALSWGWLGFRRVSTSCPSSGSFSPPRQVCVYSSIIG